MKNIFVIFMAIFIISQNLNAKDLDSDKYIYTQGFAAPKSLPTDKLNKSNQAKAPNTLTMNNFNFDLEAWLPRLVQIVNSTDGSFFSVGVCGTLSLIHI